MGESIFGGVEVSELAGDGHFAAEADEGVDPVVHVGEWFGVVEGPAGGGVVFTGLAGAPGENLVGPCFEAGFVAEDDGDEDAGAEPFGVVGCDDEREVDRPEGREPVADGDFEGALTTWERATM